MDVVDGTEEGAVVSYPDPDSHSCGWITSPLRATLFPRSGDVIHPQLWESGSGYETKGAVAWHHRWQWQYSGPDLDSCGPWAIILGGAPPKNYLTHHTCTCILK